jgi:type IV pilus assembly protein PilC
MNKFSGIIPGKKIKFSEITSFTRQFSAMLEAKISLVRIFEILILQTTNLSFKKILADIKKKVQVGGALADALARYPDIFSTFYLSMVRVGELTGRLDYMLVRVAIYLEKMNELRRKLIQSLSYPGLVIMVALVAVTFLITYVVPTFADMFRDFDAELPLITVALMNVSDFIRNYYLLIFIVIITVFMAIRYFTKTTKGRKLLDKLNLSMPVTGELVRKNYISRFTRTLSILLESGIPLLEALKVCSDSMSNSVVQQEIQRMQRFAEKGENLTHSLSRSAVFPVMVTQMISVGEETAEMDKMLQRIADYYDMEIEASLAIISSVFEPLIIVFLGIILGTILVALYMPLFDLVNIVPG